MKKHFFIIFLLFVMPGLLHSVTDEGITITKLTMEPLPFNERRDPVNDSPYNAFDGDIKSAALYSDFSMEFSKPVAIDQIRIINGNASNKELFKKQNRERDIEITLYTIAVKADKTTVDKKKKPASKKKDNKIQEKKEKTKENNEKDKKVIPSDKENKDKTKPEKIKKADPGTEKENKKDEIKKPDTPEKVVIGDEFETDYKYKPHGVKLYLAASETIVESAEKKPVQKKKVEDKKTVKKKSSKVKPSTVKKAAAAKKSEKKTKNETSGKNIIEITDSKKTKPEISNRDIIKARIAEEAEKNNALKDENETTGIQKELAGVDNSVKIEEDKPVEKVPLPDKIDVKKDKKIESKKTEDKSPVKQQSKKDTPKKKTEAKKKENKTDPVKKIVSKKITESKKTVKTENSGKSTEKKTDKKSEPVKEAVKEKVKKDNAAQGKKDIKKEEKKEVKKEIPKENLKEEKKNIPAKVVEEKVTVKKMTGIVRIEDDKQGRVLVYTSLKDSMDYQSIDLKGEYTVTKIEFRTRDDEYYSGTESDRSGITEISFLNNGKRIPLQGIDSSKKSYIERYSKNLTESLAGETFVMLEDNEIALRVTFRKDGKIEFHDRFKCAKKGGLDCTSVSMPDAWRVADGKLQMRFHTLWRVWKYELDSQSDMLEESSEYNPPQWMRIYFRSENGFTDKYLDLVSSDKAVWAD